MLQMSEWANQDESNSRAGNALDLAVEILSKGNTKAEMKRKLTEYFGMVQKRPFSGNTRDLSADPDRSRVGAGYATPG